MTRPTSRLDACLLGAHETPLRSGPHLSQLPRPGRGGRGTRASILWCQLPEARRGQQEIRSAERLPLQSEHQARLIARCSARGLLRASIQSLFGYVVSKETSYESFGNG